MDKTKKVLTETVDILQQLAAQEKAQELAYKQDCKRTALQLAERFSKDGEGNHESNPVNIIANAEILYVWLTNDTKDLVDIFMKTGILNYKSK